MRGDLLLFNNWRLIEDSQSGQASGDVIAIQISEINEYTKID